ncbi:FAD-dependent oxidoreductase [Luedemannella flava]
MGYDVIVVGARVAGAATALLLARRGLKVLMVDRSPVGSDTISSTRSRSRASPGSPGGGCSTASWPPARRRPARSASTTARRCCAARSPPSTGSTRSTVHAGRCSTRCSSTPRGPPAPRCWRGSGSRS